MEKSNTDWLKIESKYTMVSNGSHHPENCSARHKVAILVPFRDRESHLRIFLNHMHAFLMKQQLEYAIYVVELVGLIGLMFMNYNTTFHSAPYVVHNNYMYIYRPLCLAAILNHAIPKHNKLIIPFNFDKTDCTPRPTCTFPYVVVGFVC